MSDTLEVFIAGTINDIAEYEEGFGWKNRYASCLNDPTYPTTSTDFRPNCVQGQWKPRTLKDSWKLQEVIGNVPHWIDYASVGGESTRV